MPVNVIQAPDQVFEAIESEESTVIHYWDPQMGPETPFRGLFEGAAAQRPDIQFYIVDSGFIHPEFTPEQLPWTVLYKGGNSVATAPFDANEITALLDDA